MIDETRVRSTNLPDGGVSHASRTAALTTVALLAFAGNSILCRLALGTAVIDPASYTAVRLLSGALTLWLVGRFVTNHRSRIGTSGSWSAGALLFLYALTFSYAYRSLGAGTGALILFAAVQLTMIATALGSGARPLALEWCGLLLAMTGLVYLVFPGIAAPSLGGVLLMVVAGIAWGAYSLRGRGVADPVRASSENFVRSVPFVLVVAAARLPVLTASPAGLVLAALSGAVTSGLGYVVWYAALARLTATRAATVQLSVPAIAAFGGVALLSEDVTLRLLIASGAILGGIGLSLLSRRAQDRPGAKSL